MSEEKPPKFTLVNNKLRVTDCLSSVAVMSPAKPCTDRPCCCGCDCEKRKVHEWEQVAEEGGLYELPENIRCNNDYCKCEKWEVVARRTEPQFGGYPRVVFSGGISKICKEDNSAEECCIDGFTGGTHLGLKGYRIWYELWVMCNNSGLYSPGGDWGATGSWFEDPSFSIPARRTPTGGDNVVVSGNMTGSGEAANVQISTS